MNPFSIAWKLFRNNLNLYRLYITVLSITVAVCYNFLTVSLNPYMRVLSGQYVYAQTAGILGSIVLLFTAILFVSHANGFFYKLRYKEIGIYILAGISENRIGVVFALENIFTGICSMIIGLPAGILFSKLFFMLLGRAMILGVSIPFYISLKPIILLCSIFVLIILIMGLTNYNKVKHSKLINILNASKEEQKPPKLKFLRGIVSIVLIGAAYYLALNILSLPEKWPLSFLRTAILSLLLICAGTYLLFGSLLGIVLNLLIRNKQIIYRKTRLVSFSNTLFRLKTNYRSLSMTAILSAAALSAFSGSLALRYFADTNTVIEAPFSIMYMGQTESVNNRIPELIEASGHRITGMHESHFLTASVSYSDKNRDCLITSVSEVKAVLSASSESRNSMRNIKLLNQTRLADNETICILHPNLILSAETDNIGSVKLDGSEFRRESTIRAPFTGELEGIAARDVYIVSDAVYKRIGGNSKREQTIYNINISEQENSIELVQRIASIMKNPRDNLNSFAGQYQYKYYLIGAFYFMGLVMAIVFIISSFSTMYFKILSDAVHDRDQYAILRKIGMNRDEIKNSIFTQTGLAFIPAVALGTIHGSIAVKVLESLVQYRFTNSLFAGLLVTLLVMTGFYFIISIRYSKIVLRSKNNEIY